MLAQDAQHPRRAHHRAAAHEQRDYDVAVEAVVEVDGHGGGLMEA